MTSTKDEPRLDGLEVAILATDGFEQAELSEPRRALDAAEPGDFDALVLPGGVINADALRLSPQAVRFVRSFFVSDKPVAVICHAPWALIESGVVRGHRLTSWPSLKTDLTNAGAHWVDEEVVVDGKLVTSRKPDDIPAFNREVMRVFAEARR